MLRWLYLLSDRVRQRRRARAWPAHLALGRLAEDRAHRYLQRQGMQVVGRNWRTPNGAGEVDLIAREGDVLVFVEVKARASDEVAAPERAVDQDKIARLRRAALSYLDSSGRQQQQVRFDLVTVIFDAPDPVTHVRDAYRLL